jgi:hypothetical protein
LIFAESLASGLGINAPVVARCINFVWQKLRALDSNLDRLAWRGATLLGKIGSRHLGR